MFLIRVLCIAMFVGIVVFTVAAIRQDGWDLATPFLSDMQAMNWSGQFNYDFSCYLALSTLWFVWRNEGSALSLIAAPLVLLGGILIFAVYLFALSFFVDGRLDILLLGRERVARLSDPSLS